MKHAGWVLIALLFLASLAIPSIIATDPDAFRADATSRSSAILDEVSTWSAADFVVSSRPGESQGGNSPARFSGSGEHVVLHRYEREVYESYKPYPLGPGQMRIGDPTHTRTNYSTASFRYFAGEAFPAAVLWAERATGAKHGHESFRILDVVSRAALVAPPNSPAGGDFNPNEYGLWQLEGKHLRSQHEGLEGTGSGRLMFYWSFATVILHTPDGDMILQSNVIDGPTVPGVASRRIFVWFILEFGDASAEFALPPSGNHLRSLAYARKIEAGHVGAASFDSIDSLAGSLPAMSNRTGPALWIQGPLRLSLEALQDPSESNAQDSVYAITMGGTPAAYSIGGSTPMLLLSEYSTGAISAIPLLLVLGFYLREILWHAASRPVFLLYSKLTKDSLLSQKVRGLIYQTIQANPGITLLKLRHTAYQEGGGVGPGRKTIRYHLYRLESANLVAAKRAGNQMCYFDIAEGARADYEAIAALRIPSVARIARVVLANPGIRQVDLQETLNQTGFFGRTLLIHHLKKLIHKGLVDRHKDWRHCFLSPTKKLVALASEMTEATDRPASRPMAAPATPASASDAV